MEIMFQPNEKYSRDFCSGVTRHTSRYVNDVVGFVRNGLTLANILKSVCLTAHSTLSANSWDVPDKVCSSGQLNCQLCNSRGITRFHKINFLKNHVCFVKSGQLIHHFQVLINLLEHLPWYHDCHSGLIQFSSPKLGNINGLY